MNKKKFLTYSKNTALVLAVTVSMCFLGLLLWGSHRGFDFTDEGYYLNWIANPWYYPVSSTQFGFVYYPLYWLTQGNLVVLRQVNILLIFLLAAWVAWLILGNARDLLDKHWIRLGLCLSIASIAFTYFSLWLLTPSYNSLAFQALMLAVACLLVVSQQTGTSKKIFWVLLGVAGWLAFMAKPTTAVALAIAVLFYLYINQRLNLRPVVVALITGLLALFVSALWSDGSLFKFVERLTLGALDAAVMNERYTVNELFRFDRFTLKSSERPVFVVLFVATVLLTLMANAKSGYLQNIAMAACMLLSILMFLVIFDFIAVNPSPSRFSQLTIWVAGIAIVFAAIMRTISTTITTVTCKNVLCNLGSLLFFSALPHVYALGTTGNYWNQGATVGALPLMGGVLFFLNFSKEKYFDWSVLLPAICVGQCITVVLVAIGMTQPYRQEQPVRSQHYTVKIGQSKTPIYIGEAGAHYINQLNDQARAHGFVNNTPVIDLSGKAPGALYAVGAKSVGHAWLNGGHKGSVELAARMLERVACEELAASWVLAQMGGKNYLPHSLLNNYGADLTKDFDEVGRMAYPSSTQKQVFDHRLYKPNRALDQAIKACQLKRSSSRF